VRPAVELVGTYGYTAPEVAVKHVGLPDTGPNANYTFPHKFPVGLPADIWSVGAIAYEMFTGGKWDRN
jgi:serine/threonine protein kinase